MGISVVIAHYAPKILYREVLKKTIQSIRSQDYRGHIEIAISDDGSEWSQPLLSPNENQRVLSRSDIEGEVLLRDLDVNWYMVGKRSGNYKKAFLWDSVVEFTQHNNLVFLDDDHPFKKKNALTLYEMCFEKYQFIIGRIKNPSGNYRLYRGKTVQGSNFGIKRALLSTVGGFGEYSSAWGMGEDSDIFWKVYRSIGQDSQKDKKACFAGNICTEDLCSGRWAECKGGRGIFIKGFMDLHGVHPLFNPSRKKKIWVEPVMPWPFWTELLYTLFNLHQNTRRTIKTALQRIGLKLF